MSSYYNNIPIYETINISYGNIETLDTTTLKTKNLFIDNVKSSEKIITQNLTLDTDNIESLSKASTAPYTSDNNKITSKGYVDEALNTYSPDLSTCVKNNIDQTLTNKFIMTNTANEININKLKIKDFDNNNTIDTIEKIKTGGSSDNDTLTTKGFIDYEKPGKKYYSSGLFRGEIFNNYTQNTADGFWSHCEGITNSVSGYASHVEGSGNTVSSGYSHCEGGSNSTSGGYSHCEGGSNTASGEYSHCEGRNCKAQAYQAHAEGYQTTASGANSHSEGAYSIASGNYSHAGGNETRADQTAQTAIGKYNTENNTNSLLSIGNGTAYNARSDALVVKSTGEVIINSTATDTTPKLTIGTSKGIIGTTALSSSTETDDDKLATKYYVDNNAGVGKNYYVSDTLKGEIFNKVENIASGSFSHAEGYLTTASGDNSHAEGSNTTASGDFSHAEGGWSTVASGDYSHAEGYNTTASGYISHSSGYYTVADKIYMFVCGSYNLCDDIPSDPKPDVNKNKLFVVGNGTYNQWSRSDAFVVKSTGEVIINSTANNTTPKLTIGTSKGITGTTALSSSTQSDDEKIPTKYYVDTRFSKKLDVDYIVFHFCDASNTKTTEQALGSYIIDGNDITINVNIEMPAVDWAKIYLEYITIGDDTTNKYYSYQGFYNRQTSGFILGSFTEISNNYTPSVYNVILINEDRNYTNPKVKYLLMWGEMNNTYHTGFGNLASEVWRLQFCNVIFHRFT